VSGGLKVGDLYVMLSAQTSAFGKGMEDAAKIAEKVSRKIKAAANEIGRAGVAIGAGIAAALAVAAEHNATVATQVRQTKDIFATFATEIGAMMVPVLREMNVHLREMLGWWQSLTPETKQQIAHWVEIATAVGVAALAIGKVSGIVSTLMPAFEAMGAAVALGMTPLLAFGAVIAGIFVGVALLHKAWRENWGGIQEKTRSVIESISGYWNSFKEWLSTNFFDWFIDAWAAVEKSIAHAMNFLKNPVNVASREQANNASDEMIDKWSKDMKGGAMGDALKLAADQVKKYTVEGIDEWKLMLGDAVDWTKKTLGFTGKQGAVTVHTNTPEYRIGEMNGPITANESWMKDMGVSNDEMFKEDYKEDTDKSMSESLMQVSQEYDREVKMREVFNDQLDKLGSAVQSGISAFASKLGSLGETINAGIQGFQNGGIWGAIIAVFIELFSKFKRFQELIDIGNGQVMTAIQELSSGFNDLVNGLRPLIGAVGMVAHVIHQVLNPIFHIIGKVLQQLAPVIGLISTILAPIAMSFEALGGLFDMLGQVMAPVFDAINFVMKFIGETVLGIMFGLLTAWMSILGVIYNIIKSLGGDTSGTAKLYHDAEMKRADVFKQMTDLWSKGYDGLADESANAAEKVGKLGDAADKVSEQLLNIPQGFKVALAQFNATSPGSMSSSVGSSASYASNDAEREQFLQTGSITGNPASSSNHSTGSSGGSSGSSGGNHHRSSGDSDDSTGSNDRR